MHTLVFLIVIFVIEWLPFVHGLKEIHLRGDPFCNWTLCPVKKWLSKESIDLPLFVNSCTCLPIVENRWKCDFKHFPETQWQRAFRCLCLETCLSCLQRLLVTTCDLRLNSDISRYMTLSDDSTNPKVTGQQISFQHGKKVQIQSCQMAKKISLVWPWMNTLIMYANMFR